MRAWTSIGFIGLAAVFIVPTVSARQTFSSSMRDAAVQFAVRQRYLPEDIPSLAAALETMARTPKPASLSRCTAPMKLLVGRRESAAALLVNPVCSECARVVDLVKQFAKDTPNEAPTIYVGEVPSSEEESAEAVLLLHNLASEPDTRLALLQELLVRQPSTVEAVRVIARAYAPTIVARRERHELKDEPPCDADVSTPVIIYRDRVLQKTRSGRIAFDPLRDEESLHIALAAVDDLQSSEAPQSAAQSRDSHRVCRNAALTRAVRIMDRACTPAFCNPRTLSELKTINRTDLLRAFHDPTLMSVHLFFPAGHTVVRQAFDWDSVKRDQLDTISYLDNPDATVVYIIGYASGDTTASTTLARDRMFSVYTYLKNALGVKCKAIKGVWLGSATLRLRDADATLLGLSARDYRADEKILNQSVHVFVYPCADQF